MSQERGQEINKRKKSIQINKLGPLQRSNDGQLWWVDKRFNKWLESTTIHGIVHVFKGKSTLKRLFWSFIFLGSVAGLLINIVNRFQHLLSNPTATAVSLDINKDGVAFPSVTVCNLTPISSYAAAFYGISDSFNGVSDDNLSFDQVIQKCNNEISNSDAKTEKLRDFFIDGQLEINELIQSCRFGVITDDSDDNNCIGQFKPIMTNLGLCYIFNGDINSTKKVTTTGQRYGLRMEMDINQDYFETSYDNDVGVKISINPQGSLPEPVERGLAIGPGQYAYISLKTERTIDKSGKTGCRNKEIGLTHFPDSYYSETGCKLDRYVNDIQTKCNCTDIISQLTITDVPHCTVSDSCCVLRSDVLFSSMGCPVECDKLDYISSVSYSRYPLKALASKIAAGFNITTDYVYDNLLGVSIYFESVSTTVSVTSSSYSVSAFLSDLGGQLGLFIGASVISMLELGLFCVDELKLLLCTGKLKKKLNTFEKWSRLPAISKHLMIMMSV